MCSGVINTCKPHFYGPELVMLGVGYHHAGVDLSDRKLIEMAFTQADLPVLCESLCITVVNVIVPQHQGSANTVIVYLWCL